MRKLILLALLLLSTQQAHARLDSDGAKLMQYGQCILKYGTACPASAVGFPIPLPPPRFSGPYKGLLSIVKMEDYSVIKHLCSNVNAVACTVRTSTNCLVMLGPNVHDNPQALQHELSHCVGWPSDHPGAR
jgi:hypothetical protein